LKGVEPWLKRQKSPLLVLFGFSGATVKNVEAESVFVPEFYHPVLEAHPLLRHISRPFPRVPTQQVDRVINTDLERAAIHKANGALAVDMESAATLDWAQERNVPLLCLRTFFDLPGHELGPFHTLMDESNRLQVGSLLKHYTANPQRLWRLYTHTQKCRARLMKSAEIVLREISSAT
jgi:hypothetical protein